MLFNVLKNIRAASKPPVTEQRKKIEPVSQGRHAKDIIALGAGSTGDSLNNQMLELGVLFKQKGYNLRLINVNQVGWLDQVIELLETANVKFVFAFAGMAADLVTEGSGENLWTLFKVPFFRFQLDTPGYFPGRHILPAAGQVNYYWFREHNEVFSRYFDAGLSATMKPWLIETEVHDERLLREKENGPIIFLKNGNNPDALTNFWRDALPPLFAQTLLGAAESLRARLNSTTTLDIAPEIVLHARELGFEIEAARSLLFLGIAQLDDYFRRIKSRMIAESLVDFPVEVWGFNWDGFSVPAGGRLQMKGGIDYSKTTALTDSALAMIDMSPNTVSTPHDRILKCVGRQTKFVSNTQDFMAQWGLGDLGVDFSFDRESIGLRIETMLNARKRTIEEGVEASRIVREHVSQTAVVDQMLGLADLLRFGISERPAGMQNFVDWPHSL